MMFRIARIITPRFVCHLLLACLLLTIQLLPAQTAPATTVNASPFDSLQPDQGEEVTISSKTQEKDKNIYSLRGDVKIDVRDYTLRADQVTYNSSTGEAVAIGHVLLDGGIDNTHIQADRAQYNVRTQNGRFDNVVATAATHLGPRNATLSTGEPFRFSGRSVEKIGKQRYIVHHGSVTSCSLPKPKWTFNAERIDIDLSNTARIFNSTFRVEGVPVFYFPYASHAPSAFARQSGFLVPTFGVSSRKGTIIGDSFYWAINRTMDATVGAQYFSSRGWEQTGSFRARPSQDSSVNFDYVGVLDRGFGPSKIDQGGEDAKLEAQSLFPYGIRGVASLEYLSSYVFRLAFTEGFSQAVNSEVKSVAFLSKNYNGFSMNAYGARYQNFQSATAGDLITILHVPGVEVSSVDRCFSNTPFYWSFSAAAQGLTRSEPTVKTDGVVGRYDLYPRTSLPLFFRGWTLRPELALRNTYYAEQRAGVNGPIFDSPLNRRAIEATIEMRPPTLGRIFEKPLFGQTVKHTVEARVIYHRVNGVTGYQNVIRFDARDILSDSNELEYGMIHRFYIKPVQPCPKAGVADGKPCSSQSRELFSWELSQRYYFDPGFGSAIVNGKRNVVTSSADFAGIAFLTAPRRFSPIASKLRVHATDRIEGSWELDYDTVMSRINASTLYMNYHFGDFFLGGSHAFLRAPGEILVTNPVPGPDKFNQFRFLAGYGGPSKLGWSAAAGIGFDANFDALQYGSFQASHNWDCCGVSAEYRRYALGSVRNENQFRFAFTLANIGTFGNLRRRQQLF